MARKKKELPIDGKPIHNGTPLNGTPLNGKPVTKMLDPRTKRRGRPPVYTPAQRRTIAKYLRKHGLTKGLLECGMIEGFTVSIPTAMKIAAAAKPPVIFTRGRPA